MSQFGANADIGHTGPKMDSSRGYCLGQVMIGVTGIDVKLWARMHFIGTLIISIGLSQIKLLHFPLFMALCILINAGLVREAVVWGQQTPNNICIIYVRSKRA